VADRTGRDSDSDLAFLGRVEPEILDDERGAESAADRGFHGAGIGG
jgi:hypothetical protein